MKVKYSYKGDGTKAMGRSLPVSPKTCREIASFIRGRKLTFAKSYLEQVTKKQAAIPYTRHRHKVAHRSGSMASGRYPVRASKYFLQVLQNAEANAGEADPKKLVIKHASVNRARIQYGRHKGSPSNTITSHIQIVLEEESQGKSPK